MANPTTNIVVCPTTGARLCKDGRYRNFASFGTSRACVKVYRSMGWAQRAAERYKTKAHADALADAARENRMETITHVVSLGDRDVMNAAGIVYYER